MAWSVEYIHILGTTRMPTKTCEVGTQFLRQERKLFIESINDKAVGYFRSLQHILEYQRGVWLGNQR